MQMIAPSPFVTAQKPKKHLPSFEIFLSDVDSDMDLSEGCGTYIYSSPEQQNGFKTSFPTDIYSFGFVALQLLNPMFTNMEKSIVFSKARKGSLPKKVQ